MHVIVDHLKLLSGDFKEKFSDLKKIDFPTFQPMLVNLFDISNMTYYKELAEM